MSMDIVEVNLGEYGHRGGQLFDLSICSVHAIHGAEYSQ